MISLMNLTVDIEESKN